MSKQPTHWQDIQQKVFTRWCNDYLSERGMYVEDLKTDLKNGLLLINLLEILAAKPIGKRWNKHPVIQMQQFENLTLALEFIKSEGITLVNIGSDDIYDCNLRIILGLIWTLILRFEIKSGGGGDGSDDLLQWIRSKIPEYDIKNFTKDWNDGRAICALTNAMHPGLIPDHRTLAQGQDTCKKGIETADQMLGVDQLIMPDEMVNPKVDRKAMMTYLAQFRNIKPEDIKQQKPSDASRCHAHGPGLVEGISNQEAPFTVFVPVDCEGKLEVKVEGPSDNAAVTVTKKAEGDGYDVAYKPTTPGNYRVHVTVGGEHIPGSVFHVVVLEAISLGGEGELLVFFSTTSSSDKSRKDRYALEKLFTAKKTHLREDFSPWIPVDLMDKKERDQVFAKAGTKSLPIVFIDDKYIGDYDAVQLLEDRGQLDALLAMDKAKLVSEEAHMARLKNAQADSKMPDTSASGAPAAAAPVEAPAASAAAPAACDPAASAPKPKFCGSCGAPSAGSKFCTGCGSKLW